MSVIDSVNSFGFEFTNWVQVVSVATFFVGFGVIALIILLGLFAAVDLGYGFHYLVMIVVVCVLVYPSVGD